jgi:hypothetical protein
MTTIMMWEKAGEVAAGGAGIAGVVASGCGEGC